MSVFTDEPQVHCSLSGQPCSESAILRIPLANMHSVDTVTMLQWLNCAYDVFGSVQDEDCFDADTHFDSSAASLYKLLAFTDAVLSRRGVFTACMQGLEELFVAATLCGEEMQVCVAAGVHTCKKLVGERRQLKVVGATYPSEAVGPACSVEEWDVFVREVCVQTEALLFIAHKLRLQPLIKVMHTFLFTSCLGGRGLLYGKLQLVLTDRVLEAGMGSSSLTKAQWVNSILTQPCGLVRDVFGQRALLHPLESSIRFEQDTKTLHFEAELEDDLAGGDRGAKVGVRVELFDDQGPRILVGKAAFPAQLCLGQSVTDDADLQDVMCS